MNDKFFLLPLEKRQRMINAAYRVFSQSNYKKAPMAEIADAGGISKALLFHYFTNKRDLYMFLWDNAMEQLHKASSEYQVTDTSDFFEMIHRSLLAKCSVLRFYPYLYLFSVNAYYEQEAQINAEIRNRFEAISRNSEDFIWQTVDTSGFRQDVDIKLLYQEILWASDGYIRQKLLSGRLDAGQMEKDFTRMIEQWKKVYLKN